MINVILAISDNWLIGNMPRSDVRLQDLLAQSNTDFVSIAEATIFSGDAEMSPLAELTEILVPKKQILCISTSEEEHEAPVKRLYNFQPRDQSKVVLIMDNHLIEGLAHLPKTANGAAYTLYRDCGLFFPLTQATVRSGNSKHFQFPFLLVNRELLRTVGLSKPSEIPADAPQHANASISGVFNPGEPLSRLCEHVRRYGYPIGNDRAGMWPPRVRRGPS